MQPSNIFFSRDGEIKVGDFGLVKNMEDTVDLEAIKKGVPPSNNGHTKEVGTFELNMYEIRIAKR